MCCSILKMVKADVFTLKTEMAQSQEMLVASARVQLWITSVCHWQLLFTLLLLWSHWQQMFTLCDICHDSYHEMTSACWFGKMAVGFVLTAEPHAGLRLLTYTHQYDSILHQWRAINSAHTCGRITTRHWVTLTFDLAFCWAKVRSKSRLKSKSKVLLLSELLSEWVVS